MKEVPPKDYHLQILHNPKDTSVIAPVDPATEKDVDFFEKQIISIHRLLLGKGYLPSLDAIRRAAEEADGMFATNQFSTDIPQFLRGRQPEYGERRVLAVEEVFRELGFVTREELQQKPEDVIATDSPTVQRHDPEIPYKPKTKEMADSEPSFAMGDWVQVAAQTKPGHVRVPAYLLGKTGEIIGFSGMFLNPEDVAHFRKQVTRLPLYLVEFDFETVWQAACPKRCVGDKITAEIYGPWLSPVSG
ncbi:SH3-like domain-containing protein [cf. Phormidesmis sp. LEGE 11477]|uniref:SH3-like domain-containing protein n=1 Tax=cf. Phormidesmis sp. LEGE 11477 TaxID=1828680 RepID=UPI00187E6248|nr:SH3-like domain-containing protein [cf. Phormidesmis sp. LEGE 11477]MBE9061368.1 nitrile hydratase subunit beta [cf. Phormidesmis sp. LEGE 11477]